ncbi:MAG: hypothetical protein K0R65_66 [Crocinitomicaceae bacterium]|nr:hypothetical protein [Crocinitomicaceae bacterium]
MIINYLGLLLGYLNKGILFVMILSTDKIGLLNLVLSVGLLFAQFSNLGAINAIAKFLPFFRESRDQKQSFLIFNLFFVVGGILLFSAIAVLLQGPIIHFYSEKSKLFVDYYYWIIPIGIANVFFLVFESYLKAIFKNVLAVFLYEFVLRISVTVLLLLLAFEQIDFNFFFILHCMVYFIPSVILLIYLFRLDEIRFNKSTFRLSKKFRRIIFSFSLFSYSNTLGSLIVLTMDALMIAYFRGLSETGVYTTVLYLTSALQIPYKSLFRVASPLVPQYWKERNMDKMQDLYRKMSSISGIIALYMFLLVWISRNELFSYLPPEYMPGIWVFLFLMIGRVFDMYSGLNGMIFVTSKKYKYDIFFTLFLLVGVFSVNCWLIPVYGMVGAAISTGMALVVYNAGRMLFVLFAYKIHPFQWTHLWFFISFVLVLGLLELLPTITPYPIAEVLLNSVFVTVLFLGSIYFLHLEPEINAYVKNGSDFLRKKLKK